MADHGAMGRLVSRVIRRRAAAAASTTVWPVQYQIPPSHVVDPSRPGVLGHRATGTVSRFRDLRERNYVVVDKTIEVERVLAEHQTLLICRPPLFGKTFTMTMLASLFTGD